MFEDTVLIALGLSLFAGLATGIGSALAFFARRTNTKFLSLALGFSAGVMIYVSFVEIFIKAREALAVDFGTTKGTWITVAAFFGGIVLIGIIDKLVPSLENTADRRFPSWSWNRQSSRAGAICHTWTVLPTRPMKRLPSGESATCFHGRTSPKLT